MKKILLTLAVAISSLVATAQTTTDLTVITPNLYWGSKDVTAAIAGKINFDSQYGEFNIKKNISTETYTGMILDYKDAKDVQVKIQGNATDESTYSKKAEVYMGIKDAEGQITVEFPNTLGTTIEALSLQGVAAGGTITFNKITLLKGEEQEVVSDFAGMAWGGTFAKIVGSGVDILITDAYGTIAFKEPVSYEAGKAYTYNVTFSEPTPEVLQFKVTTAEGTEGAMKGDGGFFIYQDIETGVTSASITIAYEYSNIEMQCPKANNTFRGIQATLTVSDNTGISATPAAGSSAPLYNLNGQRIVSPKGIYIQNGKKYMAK